MTNQENIEHNRHNVLLAMLAGIFCASGGFLTIVLGYREPTVVHFTAFAVSTGFAIILGASGTTRASGHFGVWTIAGPGAVAIIIFLVLESYLKPGGTKFGVISMNKEDDKKVVDISIMDDHALYEYRDRNGPSAQFIMLKEKFNLPRIAVQVDTKEKMKGTLWFEMVGDGAEIAQNHLGKKWEDWIRWDFDYKNRIVKEGNSIISKR